MKALLKFLLYKPMLNAMFFLIWLMPNNNIGLAIIILTLAIRLLIYPLSLKSFKAQKELQELQPKLEEIKEKFKDDKKLQAEKTMEFYRENKISPFGSCLYAIVQIPILLILYYVFRNGLDASRFVYLYSFVPKPEAFNTIFLGMELTKPSIYLAIVAGISQYIQTRQLMPKIAKTPDTGKKKDASDQFQQTLNSQMTYVMPAMTLVIALGLPSALSLYWSVTSIFSIVQQALFLSKWKKSPNKVTVSIRNNNGK